MKYWFYKHRVSCLLLSVLLGLVLAFSFHSHACFLLGLVHVIVSERLQDSLFLVSLSLPTLFILWLYKTHDVRQQLEKTTEQISLSMFHNATSLITDSNTSRRSVGLQQLVKMGIDNASLAKSIELITASSLDLSNTNLRGINLVRVNLRGANLEKANLEKANLEGANLVEANLGKANLVEANLGKANLERANLKGANLEGANLEGANLEGSDLEGVNLVWVTFEGANLKEANLKEANLKEAKLIGVSLAGANFDEADLERAIFEKENFEKENLQGARNISKIILL